MSLNPDEAKTLGSIETLLETHVKSYDEEKSDNKAFRKKMYEKLENLDDDIDVVDTKADVAHTRIDTHEVRFSTIKWVVGTITAIITAVVGGLVWLLNWLSSQ